MSNTTAWMIAAVAAFTVAGKASGTLWTARYNEANGAIPKGSTITNAFYWANGSTYGVDGEAPDANDDYIVNSGRTIFTTAASAAGTAADSITFTGGSLTFGNAANEGRLRHYLYGDAIFDVDDGGKNQGLKLFSGYIVGLFGHHTSTISGKVRVTAPEESPFGIGVASSSMSYSFTGDFSSDPGTALSVNNINYTSTSRSRQTGTGYTFSGMFTNYFGKLIVDGPTATFADDIPGTLTLTNATLAARSEDAVFTVGTLELDSGAKISVSASMSGSDGTLLTNSLVVVTNMFVSSSKATVVVNGITPAELPGAVSVPVITVPSSSEIYPEQFTMTATRFTVVTNDVTETKTLVAVIAPVVTQTVTQSTIPSPDWSDEKAPHSGAHYQINMVDSSDTILLTDSDANLNYEFPGESLYLASSKSSLRLRCKSSYFKELRLNSNAYVLQNTCNGMLRGRVVIPDSSHAWICVYDTRTLTIAANIVGTGRIVMDGYHNSTGSRSGYTELTGDNSRFFGTITVGQNRDQLTVADNQFQTLYVSDPAKLGAPLPSFNAKSLVLKRLGRLRAKGSVTFADTTRGIFIGEDGGPGSGGATATKGTASEGQMFAGEGDTLTIRTQLTMNGRLHKYGAGTLALGGPLKFGNAESDEPLANSNLLAVAQGFVKPLAADSFNGLEMTFAAGTGIKLDINPGDADLRTYGLRNTKAVTPFVAPAGGKIPVSFDVPEGFKPQDQFQIGLATVPTAVAESVRGMLDVKRPKIGCTVSISVVTVGDAATIMATFNPVGFIISIQ